jgi:hypothetical protein
MGNIAAGLPRSTIYEYTDISPLAGDSIKSTSPPPFLIILVFIYYVTLKIDITFSFALDLPELAILRTRIRFIGALGFLIFYPGINSLLAEQHPVTDSDVRYNSFFSFFEYRPI